MNKYFILILITFCFWVKSFGFSLNDIIINSISDNITIVGLGDPTHQESTITKYRIDLIKKLTTQKGFKTIAIEGNMYELFKAHESFLKDGNIQHYERAMYSQLNISEMETLYHFIREQNGIGNTIRIVGFDSKFSGSTYVEKITEDLDLYTRLSETEKKDFISALKKANITNLKSLLRNDKKVLKKLKRYATLILTDSTLIESDAPFFYQSMRNLQNFPTSSDMRDVQMANNVTFLKELFPNDKIILFGSSSHFIKNPKNIYSNFFQNKRTTTLGNELFKSFKNSYYTIAYSAISGEKFKFKNKSEKLEENKEGSIENIYAKNHNATSFFLNSYSKSENMSTRFLGHYFYQMDIFKVIDGLVLISDIKPSKIKKTVVNKT